MTEMKITSKQLEILILLYRFRFLNRIQIQTILNHKDYRRINAWLKDLTNKKIIDRFYSKKLKENTKPAIYFLITKSKEILKDNPKINEKLLKRAYREKYRSQRFISHHIFLADFYLNLLKNIKDEKLYFFTKTDLSVHYYLPYKRPDAYIARGNKKITKRYFLETIDEGTPRFILRSLIDKYIEYYFTYKWQEKTHHAFPVILIICPNEDIKEYLKKYINQVLEEEPEAELNIYLSDREKIEWTVVSK